MMSKEKSFNIPKLLRDYEENKGLEVVWRRFYEISAIPRSSGKELEIINFITHSALENNLQFEIDSNNNLFVAIPASTNHENSPGIIFQSHVDMVAVGSPNPADHGVIPQVEHQVDCDWIMAFGTSLGAYNGIGVSLMLALMSLDITHGPIGLLFTVSEEMGLLGALRLDLKNPLTEYKYLINLDSEESGKAVISCSGAGDSLISLHHEKIPAQGKILIYLELKGIPGGHSADIPQVGRLNAARILAEIILFISKSMDCGQLGVVNFESGSAGNVVPSSATATIAVDCHNQVELIKIAKTYLDTYYGLGTNRLEFVSGTSTSVSSVMMDHSTTQSFLALLLTLPDGLIEWDHEISIPAASSNMGRVMVNELSNEIEILVKSRSYSELKLEQIRSLIVEVSNNFGYHVKQNEPYTGWAPSINSDVNNLVAESWKAVTNEKLEFSSTHGGLECGVLLQKFPHLQAISIGPQIEGAHSINERVEITSVEKMWLLIQDIINRCDH